MLRVRAGQVRDQVRRVPPQPLLQASWVISGFLLGLALAQVFGWSAVGAVVAALLLAALTWYGRGLATVAVAVTLVLAAVSATFFATLQVFPHASWHMAWLLPVSLLLVVVAVWVGRTVFADPQPVAPVAAALLDFASGGGALLAAVFCMNRVGSATGSSILLSSEDNDAWLNTIGQLHDAHGVTAQSAATVSTYGPVADSYLAYVREAMGGLLPHAVVATRTADAVVASHVLLAVLAPVVAGFLARRTLVWGRAGLTLLAWFAASVLLFGFCLVTPVYGFLTAALAVLLLGIAAGMMSGRPLDPRQRRTVCSWLATALVLFAAGSVWVPLVPLAAIALVGWYVALAWPALANGPWATVRLVGLLALPTAVLGWCLLEQYREVVKPIGGGKGLILAGGGTAAAGDVMIAVALGFAALGWGAQRFAASGTAPQLPTMSTTVVWLLAYTAVLTLDDGWVGRALPHYGSIKLLFVVVLAVLVLGVIDLLASPAVGTRRLSAAAGIVVAAILAATVDAGPLYAAADSHWPKAIPLPPWVATVDRAVASPGRVLCLGTATPKPDESTANLDAYNCSRWAASLQGVDDPTAGNWRFVQLGRYPVSTAVADLKRAKAQHAPPWTIVVIGPVTALKDPKSWWAPLLKGHQLNLVAAGS